MSPTSLSNSKSKSRSTNYCVEPDLNLADNNNRENINPKIFMHRLSKRDTNILKLFASRAPDMRRKRQSEIYKNIFVEPLSPPKIDELQSKERNVETKHKENCIPLK